MKTIFDADSFGAHCPVNWEEIAVALNQLVDEHNLTDPDDISALFETYCLDGLDTVPAPVMPEDLPNKEEFITYLIQHSDDYPFTGEISLDSAILLLDLINPKYKPADITPEDAMEIWNRLVHDPEVMDE